MVDPIIPDPSPDGTPDPNPNPSGELPAPGERPDWLPEDAWDADAQAPILDKLGELVAGAGKDSDVPADGTDYTPPAIEGLEAEVIARDPTYQAMATVARDLGVGQERFGKAVEKYITDAIKAEEEAAANVMTELGENAPARLQAIANWASGRLSKEEFQTFRSSFTSKDNILVLEKLMGAKASTAPRASVVAAPAKTREQINEIMASDDYYTNPAKLKEVADWYAKTYPEPKA